jgi:hypothetical protein
MRNLTTGNACPCNVLMDGHQWPQMTAATFLEANVNPGVDPLRAVGDGLVLRGVTFTRREVSAFHRNRIGFQDLLVAPLP